MLSDAELKRLRWRCTHRAQLEMDLLLGNFLDKHFSKLSPEQVVAFAELAELEDRELWPLVTGKQPCDNPAHAEVLKLMRRVRDD